MPARCADFPHDCLNAHSAAIAIHGREMVFSAGMKELVPIDQAGRIVLPKAFRQELAIKAGDLLEVSVHGSSVTLVPKKEAAALVRKGRGWCSRRRAALC